MLRFRGGYGRQGPEWAQRVAYLQWAGQGIALGSRPTGDRPQDKERHQDNRAQQPHQPTWACLHRQTRMESPSRVFSRQGRVLESSMKGWGWSFKRLPSSLRRPWSSVRSWLVVAPRRQQRNACKVPRSDVEAAARRIPPPPAAAGGSSLCSSQSFWRSASFPFRPRRRPSRTRIWDGTGSTSAPSTGKSCGGKRTSAWPSPRTESRTRTRSASTPIPTASTRVGPRTPILGRFPTRQGNMRSDWTAPWIICPIRTLEMSPTLTIH